MTETSTNYLDPRVLNRVAKLELRARLVVEGFVTGMHKSPYRGFSVEFAQHREYVPGDDLRHLDWKIFGKADPNVRKATAIVNDTVITGTDVDQRLALIVALNNFKLSAEDTLQLRLQVLRSLIDETLQIQAAAADKIKVSREEIDKSFDRVAQNFGRTPDEMRAWLRSIGSSERSIKSSTRRLAPTTTGATLFEKRYGRARCRRMSTISCRPAT